MTTDTTFRIRTARPEDTAALDALFARAYPKLLKPDYPPSVLVTAVPLISRAQPHLIASGTFYVAEAVDGTLIGAGGWTPSRRPGWGDVRHVVTDDRWLRRGIARALMARSFQTALTSGIRDLDCKSTRTAVPFYQSLGFIPLGPIEVTLAQAVTFPAVHMQKRL